MRSRVCGVIRASVSAAEKAKRSPRGSAPAPACPGKLDHGAIDGKAGVGIENIGAGLAEQRIDMNMVGLPPGRIITSSGDRHREACEGQQPLRATANPTAGV